MKEYGQPRHIIYQKKAWSAQNSVVQQKSPFSIPDLHKQRIKSTQFALEIHNSRDRAKFVI